MKRRKKTSSKVATPEKLRRQHEKKLQDTSAIVDLPQAQRAEGTLVLHLVPQIGQEPTPVKQTVRKLTRIEQLARSGVLEPHEAAACEKYADWHQAGFEVGLGCTANYEGRSGGGNGAPDLLARYKAQQLAREDYLWARTFIPAAYLRLFEGIVLGSDTIGDIASQAFEQLKRSQAEHKTRVALKFCANLLHGGIGPLLAIDAPAPKASAEPAAPPAREERAGAEPPAHQVGLAVCEGILRAHVEGRKVAAIVVAVPTLAALERELGCTGLTEYQGLPVVPRIGWAWGYLLDEAEPASLAA